jgi:hypothetical protein
VLKTQKNEIDRLHQIIDAHRKQKNDRRAEFKEKLREYFLFYIVLSNKLL